MVALLFTAALGCGGTLQSSALTQADAFQSEYDRDLIEDELSFLTTVAAHYLQVGESLALVLGDDQLKVSFERELAGMWVTTPQGERVLASRDDPLVLDAEGRWRVDVSAQGPLLRILVHDRDAPARNHFPGVTWFPLAAEAIVQARFEANPQRPATVLQTSRGVTKTLYDAGTFHFELGGRPQTLVGFAGTAEAAPDEVLLVPFMDATTGHESYAAGRYLEFETPAPDESVVLDFNRATNPLCAYSDHYNCPFPPGFNRVEGEVRAGAKAPSH